MRSNQLGPAEASEAPLAPPLVAGPAPPHPLEVDDDEVAGHAGLLPPSPGGVLPTAALLPQRSCPI